MERDREGFIPDQVVPQPERAMLRFADRLEISPYFDPYEVTWEWLQGTAWDREHVIATFTHRVHVNDPKQMYTVEIPPLFTPEEGYGRPGGDSSATPQNDPSTSSG